MGRGASVGCRKRGEGGEGRRGEGGEGGARGEERKGEREGDVIACKCQPCQDEHRLGHDRGLQKCLCQSQHICLVRGCGAMVVHNTGQLVYIKCQAQMHQAASITGPLKQL